MSASVAQFVERLKASGIVSAEQLASIEQRDLTPFRPTEDGRAAAQLLVQRKKLTPFQAIALDNGHARLHGPRAGD